MSPPNRPEGDFASVPQQGNAMARPGHPTPNRAAAANQGSPTTATAAGAVWAADLHACAQPLIALATQLRTQVPADPAATGRAVREAVADFERELSARGGHERTVIAASYLLCVWLDEVIAAHAWAASAWSGTSLLAQFHQEEDGRKRVFQLLDRLMQQPAQERPLLELFHVCLSLGLQGRWQDAADGARQLDALRQRLAQLLGLSAVPAEPLPLSSRWQPAAGVNRPRRGWALRLGAVLLCGLAALGVYATAQWSLARQVDQVFSQMQGLELSSRSSARVAAAASGITLTGPGRLASALAAEMKGGQLEVRDESNRSVLVLGADALFDPDTARLAAGAQQLLAPIAQALSRLGGRVLVTAHALPEAPRPARVVSASQLADLWAGQVQQVLQGQRPPATVDAEGRAQALAAPAGQAAPRNHIEIVWFP